jgi:predicted anti-sigma-YlaC factor YlaD
MRCDLAREALSAQLDDELTPLEEDGLAAHVKGCASCRSFARDLASLHRTVRLRQAAPVPDLTRAIMATAGPHLPAPRRSSSPSPAPTLRTRWARAALFGVAVVQFALALPELVIHSDAGHSAHMTRELGAFGVALAIGMLVVAWQPQRAGGLLPMTFALTTAVTVTAVADVVLGHSGPSGQAPHFLELIGLVLLWYLARVSRAAPVEPAPPRAAPSGHWPLPI